MKCDYCGIEYEREPVVKVIRGKRHTFCSEYCFVLHHHGMPVPDMVNCGGANSVLVKVPDFRELIKRG